MSALDSSLIPPSGGAGGVLPLDKPTGPSSHDCVAGVRRVLGIRQVGHAGTLDPFASGLLLVCFGPATRLAPYLTPLRKTYLARMRLGEATDTDDLTGQSISRSDGWSALTDAEIAAALATQTGLLHQIPPLYSAKKVAGERMYAAARRGETVERTPSAVTVHRIELGAVRLPEVEFEVECSSGTYIRAIARDVGDALGVGGHLSALRRTRIGAYDVEAAVPLDALPDGARLREAILSPSEAVAHLPRLRVDDEGARAIRHGRAVPAMERGSAEGPIALVSEEGTLLAIGTAREGEVHPRKVFA